MNTFYGCIEFLNNFMCFKCRTLTLWEKREYWNLFLYSAFQTLQNILIAHLNAHSFSQTFSVSFLSTLVTTTFLKGMHKCSEAFNLVRNSQILPSFYKQLISKFNMRK